MKVKQIEVLLPADLLFAADLFRMYQAYGDQHGLRSEILAASETGIGGYKEIIFSSGQVTCSGQCFFSDPPVEPFGYIFRFDIFYISSHLRKQALYFFKSFIKWLMCYAPSIDSVNLISLQLELIIFCTTDSITEKPRSIGVKNISSISLTFISSPSSQIG